MGHEDFIRWKRGMEEASGVGENVEREMERHTFKELRNSNKICVSRDFPGGPVVKTLPSNAGDAGSTPDWRAKIPHASAAKKPQRKTEAIL